MGFVQDNIVAIGAGAGGLLIGTGLGLAASKKKSTKKSRRKSTRSSKKRKGSYARTAGKRKDTSRRRIRMTKTGQPYVILASGKARFISKKSARLSRKRKGGRY
jgi:hypothetical protein